MERRTRSPSSSSERWPHRKTTALHGAARHGCEDRERGRQIPTSAESAWECRCKRRRKVRRLIGRQLPYRPMSSRLLSSVDRPTFWPCSSFENTNGRQDKGLWNLCLATWRSRDLLGSEATAGIEPAMKVLQTSALPLGYVAWEPQERACSLSVATTATRREAPYVAA